MIKKSIVLLSILALFGSTSCTTTNTKGIAACTTLPEGFHPVASDLALPNNLNQKNSIFLVNFWADWCGPCKLHLQRIVGLETSAPIVFVLIEGIKDKEALRAELKKNGLVDDSKITYIFDPQKEISDKLNVMSIPTILLVKNHNIIGRYYGVIESENVQQLENYLQKCK